MKVMEMKDGYCFSDITFASKRHDLSKVDGLMFIEAPDFVFPGWGYDATQEGDLRFIKPIPPSGWNYDDDTGSFYKEDGVQTNSDQLRADIDYIAVMTGVSL